MSNGKRKTYTRRDSLRLSIGGAMAALGTMNLTAKGQEPQTAPARNNPKHGGPVKTRMFWTWDHSTEWRLNGPGAQTLGASNYYARPNEYFIEDYTRLLEFCGRHHIDAVVIWGLLRDTHGGLESAKRLCETAAKNGVRVLCGVGLCAYGGVYYEGDSPYSLESHLKKHPELKGVNLKSEPMDYNFGICGPRISYHACPSRKENQDFMAESLQWLFQNLPLGGVQIESGDTGTCQCRLCRERRKYPVRGFSWEDMALLYPQAIKAVRSVNPEAWICCETYSNPEPYTGPDEHPDFGQGKTPWADECIAKIPEGVFIQWVCDQFVPPISKRTWTKAGTVDTKRHRHIMRSHFGTYWGGIRGELAADWFADAVQQSLAHNFDGIYLFGEVSPYHTGAELNYLALENYGSAANPKADVNIFLRDVAGPLLGGESQAHDYLKYARLKGDANRLPDALNDIYKRCGTLPADAARRWAWLGNFLASTIYRET